ncbi:hypothetical protein PsorP6_002748 [Peronosclerospora sorghi]|uniref:Uncharacterized protein n=1 Tax=Peronosclerospora sorghi TaxID=230839 RepID=A0ACC0WW78_9STRA|nr:hypothetical protein PsorP6_002748 [Peronosclerospora sorghi]
MLAKQLTVRLALVRERPSLEQEHPLRLARASSLESDKLGVQVNELARQFVLLILQRVEHAVQMHNEITDNFFGHGRIMRFGPIRVLFRPELHVITRDMAIMQSTAETFTITHPSEKTKIVKLYEKICTCKHCTEWGLPFYHALAIIREQNLEWRITSTRFILQK